MRTIVTSIAALLLMVTPAVAAREPVKDTSCGRVNLHGARYLVEQHGSTCATAARILHTLDHQRQTGTTHPVPGDLQDLQLPYQVDGWRCGGAPELLECERGHWTSPTPPTGHPVLKAHLLLG